MRPRRGHLKGGLDLLGSGDHGRIGGTLLGAKPELPEGLRVLIKSLKMWCGHAK